MKNNAKKQWDRELIWTFISTSLAVLVMTFVLHASANNKLEAVSQLLLGH